MHESKDGRESNPIIVMVCERCGRTKPTRTVITKDRGDQATQLCFNCSELACRPETNWQVQL